MSSPDLPETTDSLVPAPEDTKTFAVALQMRLEQRSIIEKTIRELCIPGTDYGLVHQKSCVHGPKGRDPKRFILNAKGDPINCPACGQKHSMWKGAAEKIAHFMGTVARFTTDAELAAILNGKSEATHIALTCTLVNKNGSLAGEGRGSACVEENQCLPNKTIKMAKKSALLDAVLTAFGLSSVFTQDIETQADLDRFTEDSPPPRQGSSRSAPPRKSEDRIVLTEGQVVQFHMNWFQPQKEWRLVGGPDHGASFEDIMTRDGEPPHGVIWRKKILLRNMPKTWRFFTISNPTTAHFASPSEIGTSMNPDGTWTPSTELLVGTVAQINVADGEDGRMDVQATDSEVPANIVFRHVRLADDETPPPDDPPEENGYDLDESDLHDLPAQTPQEQLADLKATVAVQFNLCKQGLSTDRLATLLQSSAVRIFQCNEKTWAVAHLRCSDAKQLRAYKTVLAQVIESENLVPF